MWGGIGLRVSYRYRDLIAWQKAKGLVVETYRLTKEFPQAELYGLTAQMRRAAISVASNIAEGQGRLAIGEFVHFLGQARGSLLELKTQLEIALELAYLSSSSYEKCEALTAEVERLINGLIEALRVRKTAQG